MHKRPWVAAHGLSLTIRNLLSAGPGAGACVDAATVLRCGVGTRNIGASRQGEGTGDKGDKGDSATQNWKASRGVSRDGGFNSYLRSYSRAEDGKCTF